MDILELVHEDRSSTSRPFGCSEVECFKTFARRSDLVRHMRIHSNDRPFACEWPRCRRDFIQRSALTVHMRVHTGERPHACEFEGCDKAFSDSSSLARHRRIHTGKRPYKCRVSTCLKTFCRKTTFTKHIKRNHPGSPSGAYTHGLVTPHFEYEVSAASNSPTTPSEYEYDQYSPAIHLATPESHSGYFPLPPQSDGPYYKPINFVPHNSPGAWSAPGEIESLREQIRRRESGESAYSTPPPHHRPLREPSPLHPGEDHYAHHNEVHPYTPSLTPSPQPSFTYPVRSAEYSTHFIATPSYIAPYSQPLPQHETYSAPSPVLQNRRASSVGVLGSPFSGSAVVPTGLGISFDERPRRFSEFDDFVHVERSDSPTPASSHMRRASSSSSAFPPAEPRASFSSYITHHLDRMAEDADVFQNATDSDAVRS